MKALAEADGDVFLLILNHQVPSTTF